MMDELWSHIWRSAQIIDRHAAKLRSLHAWEYEVQHSIDLIHFEAKLMQELMQRSEDAVAKVMQGEWQREEDFPT